MAEYNFSDFLTVEARLYYIFKVLLLVSLSTKHILISQVMLSPPPPTSTPFTLPASKDLTSASNGSVLAIGSLATAATGKYQSLISSLKDSAIEKQMLDRLIDGGALF